MSDEDPIGERGYRHYAEQSIIHTAMVFGIWIAIFIAADLNSTVQAIPEVVILALVVFGAVVTALAIFVSGLELYIAITLYLEGDR